MPFCPLNKAFLQDSFPLLILSQRQVIDKTQTWLSPLWSFCTKSGKETDSPQKEDPINSYAMQQNLVLPPPSQQLQSYYFSKKKTNVLSNSETHTALYFFHLQQKQSTILLRLTLKILHVVGQVLHSPMTPSTALSEKWNPYCIKNTFKGPRLSEGLVIKASK